MALQGLMKDVDNHKLETEIAGMAMGDIVPFLAKTGSSRLGMMRVRYNHKDGPEGVVVGWINEDKLIVRVTMTNYEKMGNYFWYTESQARAEFLRAGNSKSWHNPCLIDTIQEKGFRYVMMDPRNLIGVKEEPKDQTDDKTIIAKRAEDSLHVADDLQVIRERLYANYGISPVVKFAEIHMRLLKEMRVYEGDGEHCRLCGAHKGGEQHAASCSFLIAFDIEADKVKAEMAKAARKRVPQTRNAFLETFTRRMPPMKRKFVRMEPHIEE